VTPTLRVVWRREGVLPALLTITVTRRHPNDRNCGDAKAVVAA
jgi:hypothetical protein